MHKTFLGYRRENGRVGVRNHVIVLPVDDLSNAAAEAGYGHFGFFEFAWVGVPLLLGTVLIVAALAPRLLPERKPANLPGDFGQHARTLTDQFALTGVARLYGVTEASALIGTSREALEAAPGISLIAGHCRHCTP